MGLEKDGQEWFDTLMDLERLLQVDLKALARCEIAWRHCHPKCPSCLTSFRGTGAHGIGGGRSPQISTEMVPPCGDMERFRWKRQGDWWTEESGWAVAISMFKAIWVGSSGVLWCFLAVGAAWRLLESYRALCGGLTASHHPGGWGGHLLRRSRRGS